MRWLMTADFVDRDDIGGAGRVLVESAARLRLAGEEVAILAGGPVAARSDVMFRGVSIPWIAFPYRTFERRGVGFWFRTRREIRRAWGQLPWTPDRLVHHQPFTASTIDRITSIPSAYVFHSPWALEFLADRHGHDDLARLSEHGPLTRLKVGARARIERGAVRRSERWIVLSETMRTHLTSLYGIERDTIEVVPGGADLERFRPLPDAARRAARRRAGAQDDELLLVAVRRLVPRTGIDLLLRAIASVRDDLAPWRLLVAGNGPERATLEALSTELGLDDRVRFLGYVPDEELPALYAAGDLSVVPSRTLEGFGLSTLESLASGTPVLATSVGGSVEILEDLDPRLLAAHVSHDALAERLTDWAGRRRELAMLRPASRSHVETRYDWNRMADTLLGRELTAFDDRGAVPGSIADVTPDPVL